MEETLQCISARGANDLAYCLKLGVGKGNGTFCMRGATSFDSIGVSVSLCSLRFHQDCAPVAWHACVLRVCLCV